MMEAEIKIFGRENTVTASNHTEEERIKSFMNIIKDPELVEEVYVDYLMYKRFTGKPYKVVNWEKLYFGDVTRVITGLHAYNQNKKLIIPVIITSNDLQGLTLDLIEDYITSLLGFLKTRVAMKELDNKTIEVRMLTDKDPSEGLKKLADKYGVRIEVNPSKIEEIKKEMIANFKQKTKLDVPRKNWKK